MERRVGTKLTSVRWVGLKLMITDDRGGLVKISNFELTSVVYGPRAFNLL